MEVVVEDESWLEVACVKRENTQEKADKTSPRNGFAESSEKACGDSDGVHERGPRRKEGAPRRKGHANVSLGSSWCCPPGVAVAVVVTGEVANAVIWNVELVAVGVPPALPPSVLLSQEAQGVMAWWGSPPIRKDKVFLSLDFQSRLQIRLQARELSAIRKSMRES